MSSRATSGASVRPECRSVPISAATTFENLVHAQAGNGDAHAQRAEHFAHPPHELLEIGIVARREREQRNFVEARVGDTTRAPLARSFPLRECAAAA